MTRKRASKPDAQSLNIGGFLVQSRHLEVIQLAAAGHSDAEAAEKLGLSLDTVRTHWRNILKKTKLTRNEVIVQYAREAEEQKSVSTISGLSADLARVQSLLAELEDTKRQLEEALKDNQRMLAENMRLQARTIHAMAGSAEALKSLDAHCRAHCVVFHSGEYGASWRKHYMSESIQEFGLSSQDWLDGKINIYDFQRPVDTARALKELENWDGKRKRCIIPYIATFEDGTQRQMVDFIKLEPYDSEGIGSYTGHTFEVTEWVEEIKALIDSGWPLESTDSGQS